ncbi:unnamed protein product, partial [Polarella glacialis]
AGRIDGIVSDSHPSKQMPEIVLNGANLGDVERGDVKGGGREEPGAQEAGPLTCLSNYFKKFAGDGTKSPPRVPLTEVLWSFIGTVCGIGCVAALHWNFAELNDASLVMIIGSFGATAVLVYGAPSVPLSQPRNVIGGHTVSAIVGVSVRMVISDMICQGGCYWASSALAVALAISAMQLTKTLHPPGGAT